MRVKSESEKRLIIKASLNNKEAYFLVDTGATVGMIDKRAEKEYKLQKGNKYNGTIIGAGGEIKSVYHCDTFAEFQGKQIPQFLFADLGDIIKSIKRETGIEIVGILCLKQMSFIGMNIDVNSREIWLE